MRVYVWRGRNGAMRNFGDELSLPLLARYAGIDAEWSAPVRADLLVCGSVLSHVPDGWAGTVLGTGTLRSGPLPDLSRARILAVRGPLTASLMGLRDVPLGDPGLLAPGLIAERPRELYKLASIPHWSDVELAARHPGCHVVNVRLPDPIAVIIDIASAESVVTSSLHGLLIAWAFGISATTYPHARTEREGGTWKWRDACLALGVEHRWGELLPPPERAIRIVQGQLVEVFSAVVA